MRWAVFLMAAALCAQNPPAEKEVDVHTTAYVPRVANALKVDATLVESAVVVRDGRGRAVGGLQKGDFEIRDNGKKREIKSFAVETAVHAGASPGAAGASSVAGPIAGLVAPSGKIRTRFVGLLFDDLNSEAGDLIRARIAAERFMKEGLQPGDQLSVFTTFGRQLLPFTNDAAKIEAALAQVRPHNLAPDRGTCPTLTQYEAYMIISRQDPAVLPVKVDETRRCGNMPQPRGRRSGTSDAVDDTSPDPAVQQTVNAARRIWDQVEQNSRNTLLAFRDIVDYMGRLHGERLILAESGGFLSGSLEMEQDEIVDRALHAGVVIDALDAKGLYTQSPVESVPGMSVRSVIMQQDMGTRPQMASNDAMANLAYGTGGIFFHNNNDLTAGIREMMAPEVTYRIGFAPEAPDGKYHKLKVKANAKGADVQARAGYMAVAVKDEERAAPRKIDEAVLGTDARHDAPAGFQASVEGGTVSVVLHIDLKDLKMQEVFGASRQKLTYVAALMDEQGNFVMGEENEIELALKAATLAQYREGGMNLKTALKAAAGKYKVRAVVEVAGDGGNDGKTTAETIAVEVK